MAWWIFSPASNLSWSARPESFLQLQHKDRWTFDLYYDTFYLRWVFCKMSGRTRDERLVQKVVYSSAHVPQVDLAHHPRLQTDHHHQTVTEEALSMPAPSSAGWVPFTGSGPPCRSWAKHSWKLNVEVGNMIHAGGDDRDRGRWPLVHSNRKGEPENLRNTVRHNKVKWLQ